MGNKERSHELPGGSGRKRGGQEVEEAVQSEGEKDETKKETGDHISDFHIISFDIYYIDINTICVKIKFGMRRKRTTRGQDSSGVHVWLVFMKAFQALVPHAAGSIKRTKLGDSDFRVLEVLLHKGPLPVNTIGP